MSARKVARILPAEGGNALAADLFLDADRIHREMHPKRILPKPDDRKRSHSFGTSSGSIPTMSIDDVAAALNSPRAHPPKSKFAPQYTGCRYDVCKPPYSYASLIAQALLATPDRRLTLNQIYQWIMDKYPYYRSENSGWQNSIRHNLSLNTCFRKLAKTEKGTGKGSFWTLNEEELAAFKDGAFKRRKLAPGSNQHSRRRRRREQMQMQMQLQLQSTEPILQSICDWEASNSTIGPSTTEDAPLFDWESLAATVRAQNANAPIAIRLEEIYRASSPSNLPLIRGHFAAKAIELGLEPMPGQAGLTFGTWEMQRSAAEVRTDYTDPLEILNKM